MAQKIKSTWDVTAHRPSRLSPRRSPSCLNRVCNMTQALSSTTLVLRLEEFLCFESTSASSHNPSDSDLPYSRGRRLSRRDNFVAALFPACFSQSVRSCMVISVRCGIFHRLSSLEMSPCSLVCRLHLPEPPNPISQIHPAVSSPTDVTAPMTSGHPSGIDPSVTLSGIELRFF